MTKTWMYIGAAGGASAVSWLDTAEQILRIGGALVAIIAGAIGAYAAYLTVKEKRRR